MNKYFSSLILILLALCYSLQALDLVSVKMRPPLSIEGVGAGQGVEWRNGLLYFYGDRGIGVMREYQVKNHGLLEYTGKELQFTVEGNDTVSHPTGLTWDAKLGTFLGDTVSGQGTIYKIDWEKLLAEGNLDNAILNTTMDDLAVNGTRPEFVSVQGKRLIATADYGEERNAIRLYDPEKLASSSRTSDPGVLVKTLPCTPWVQTIHWLEKKGLLVLVQNQIEGLLWRLSLVDLESSWKQGEAVIVQVLDFQPEDELEGFHFISPNLGIFVSSSRRDNVIFGEFNWVGENSDR